MKRAILVHGWRGNPNNSFFPWLSVELEKRGFKVERPAMPYSDYPKIEPWVAKIAEVVGEPDEDTILIGHSIGCQSILRYLQTLSEKEKVGGIFLVGSWVQVSGLEDGEEKEVARPWLETEINFAKARQRSPYFVAIFSDNDLYVPLSNAKLHEEELGAKTIVEHKMGHFDDDSNITAVPVLLEEIIKRSA